MCVIWLVYMCDLTYSYVWHDTFIDWCCFYYFIKNSLVALLEALFARYVWQDSCICVIWLVHVLGVRRSHVGHDSFRSMMWLIHMCDRTCLHVCQDSLTCVTKLVHMCDTTDSYVWQDSWIRVTRLIYVFDETRSYVWHDSFMCVRLIIHMFDKPHSYVWTSRVSNIHRFYKCKCVPVLGFANVLLKRSWWGGRWRRRVTDF